MLRSWTQMRGTMRRAAAHAKRVSESHTLLSTRTMGTVCCTRREKGRVGCLLRSGTTKTTRTTRPERTRGGREKSPSEMVYVDWVHGEDEEESKCTRVGE